MSQTYFTILTDLGVALLAQATATQVPLKITSLAVGDGNGEVPTPSSTQTTLVNEVRRASVNTIYTSENDKNNVIVEQVIPAEDGGFYIREFGIFDDKGNMIAVGNCPPSYKPKLAEGSGKTQVINAIISIDNDSNVELKIDPTTVLATREFVEKLVDTKMQEHEQSTKHPDATTKSKGFVQLDSSTDSDSEVKAATPKAVSEVMKVACSAVKYTTDEDGKKYVDEKTNFIKGLQKNGVDVISKDEAFGCGQTWKNVTSSRSAAVTYTNTTGKPIFVSVIWSQSGAGNMNLIVDGNVIASGQQQGVTGMGQVSGIIPAGSKFMIDTTNYISSWNELR